MFEHQMSCMPYSGTDVAPGMATHSQSHSSDVAESETNDIRVEINTLRPGSFNANSGEAVLL